MRLATFYCRSLVHHWRAHVAVGLGVAVGTAVLTGALLVGDSLRGSLRAAALHRLGNVDFVLESPRFFRAKLADELNAAIEPRGAVARASPAILLRGTATLAGRGTTAHGVSALGVEPSFASMWPALRIESQAIADRCTVLSHSLAAELGAQPGDDILLRVTAPPGISPETLLGRRAPRRVALRLTVQRVLPEDPLGDFALRPRPTPPRNAYVPLATLQRILAERNKVNTLFLAGGAGISALETTLHEHLRVEDYGLRVRTSEPHGYLSLESDALLLPPPVEAAARAAGAALAAQCSPVLTYLANTIQVADRPATSIPYSTVAAVPPSGPPLTRIPGTNGAPPTLSRGEILLSEWAARELDATLGQTIQLSYYVMGPFGRLDTRTTRLRLAGVYPLTGAADDPGFAPHVPGISDADHLEDWQPPFPIDLTRIRPQDEAYWDAHGAAPKALLTLADGLQWWTHDADRFGRLTALRLYPPRGRTPDAFRREFTNELLARLTPADGSLRIDPVRQRATTASRGTTDFAGLFLGFSFFLIAAAAILVGLLFRLGVEYRAREIGLLLAVGFRPRRVAGLLLLEGAVVTALGAGVGLIAARGYTSLMLVGLRTTWSAAVPAPPLGLHVSAATCALGVAGSLAVAAAALICGVRGLVRNPTRVLLAGGAGDGAAGVRRSGSGGVLLTAGLAFVALALGLLPAVTQRVPATLAFFGGGAALLAASLAGLRHWLRRSSSSTRQFTGRAALLRLSLRNARRQPARSLLTTALIAAAAFVITSLQAMRLTVARDLTRLDSPAGGFSLLAQSTAPLLSDLNTPDGRAAAGISAAEQAGFADVTTYACRLRPGDDASCLNLYVPTQPRILGVPDTLLARGGFSFAQTLAASPAERQNPWRLLQAELPADVIPAIADQAAARWQLHLKLGEDLTLRTERARTVRLRLVALLNDSVLQGEVIIAESRFVQLYPSTSGHAFFLIDTPPDRAAAVAQTLEHALADYALAVTPVAQRLTELFAVQNTYLSTFQMLGGFGLLLGTLGLAAIMLRNVWQRRAELATMRCLGFSRRALGWLVLLENAFLVGAGLLAGVTCAAIVVAPHVLGRAAPIPWGSLLAMFAGILLAGMLAGTAALLPTLRTPLLPALRRE